MALFALIYITWPDLTLQMGSLWITFSVWLYCYHILNDPAISKCSKLTCPRPCISRCVLLCICHNCRDFYAVLISLVQARMSQERIHSMAAPEITRTYKSGCV